MPNPVSRATKWSALMTRTNMRCWSRGCGVVWLLIIGLTSGCELISTTNHAKREEFRLPPIVAPKQSVQVEILFVDRPTDDAIMGDSLWREIDQIAGLPADTRLRLRRNGWRLGHCGSHPPRALAELLELSSGKPEVIDPSRRLIGRTITVLAGSDAPIEVTDVQPTLSIFSEKSLEPRIYEDAKCIVRVHIDREQDGWVKLKFQPEIHHGETIPRLVATPLNWTRRRAPEIEPLYDQQFEMNLNVGELAVLTAGETDSQTVGDAFFRSLDKSGKLQRMLVVRINDMQKLTPNQRR